MIFACSFERGTSPLLTNGGYRRGWCQSFSRIDSAPPLCELLPPEVQQAEYQEQLISEVNAERVPGAKLVKAFNQLPFKVLASPLPDNVGRKVVFVASDHEDASATVAALAESLGFATTEVGKIAEGGRLIQAPALWFFRISSNTRCRVGRKATVHRSRFDRSLMRIMTCLR